MLDYSCPVETISTTHFSTRAWVFTLPYSTLWINSFKKSNNKMLFFIVATVFLYPLLLDAEPFGPPQSACYTLEPSHYSTLLTPNVPMDDPPYELVWELLEDEVTYRGEEFVSCIVFTSEGKLHFRMF